MPTPRDLERFRVVRDYGRNCFLCADGPLFHRGLFTRSLGYSGKNAPVCKSCNNRLEAGETTQDLLTSHIMRSYALFDAASRRLSDLGVPVPRRPSDMWVPRPSLED